ncbi:GNAT family N-acetyltransferase [Ancylomarina euxinus]|uniref:GNAT family N-acetyltransferase n=1 Tax=Ancylomarina euxinus TaxID=2283627 RepID=UPI00177F3A59|nr:GNAT family N-acetyltransferase [Ancylomarina euxinus]MCZ4693200.1 GNAT family N-acetyltransferase [Ancylomarina euxinus]
MNIIEVVNKSQKQSFLDFARTLYRNDPNFACPLDGEINGIFDPKENSFFKHGEAIRWILSDDDGKVIGRIAAFINTNKAFSFDQPTGGCGFFECIEDKDAAFLLFDTAKNWLKERGMEAMDGPINFGENDNHWGLLVEGFMPQGFGMPYHKAYYQEFFESYGFQVFFEQYSYHVDRTKPFPERFAKIAEWISKKPGFEFEHFQFSNSEKYIQDIIEVYNEAWKFHDNFTPIDIEDIRKIACEGKGILEEEFIWFAYHEGKPVGFFVAMPDINQILIKLNGKLDFWNKLKFFYYLKRKTITRTRITVMGVLPRYQRFGIESAIFWQMDKAIKAKKQYTEVELSWVGDFNPKMISIYESVGGVRMKKHHTYRFLFDPKAPFKRTPIIPLENRVSKASKE